MRGDKQASWPPPWETSYSCQTVILRVCGGGLISPPRPADTMLPLLPTTALVVVALLTGANGCSVGFVEINGECFYFRSEVGTWEAAHDLCLNLTDSRGLAEVKSANTLRAIYEYIRTYDLGGSFWLGATDQAYEGDWLWTDGSRVARGTPFWALHYSVLGWSQEPSGGSDENCLSLDKDRYYYFNDANCDNGYYPICQGL
ncbi:perlucin [Procambarus clarkii]|uniref:perlucin n=1 Tax=Procambarus clarkii TaxID=6728 RepID=UPI001E6776D5|nr:perlucin-like [Procambarus clarkii]